MNLAGARIGGVSGLRGGRFAAAGHGLAAAKLTIVAAFVGFALARMAASLLVGPWIDRWGAARLFPLILIPACRAECVEPWDAAGDFGTALGPLLLGGLLKAGATFHVIVPACAILGMVVVGVSLQARSSLRRANGKA
jgi:hypothetical protein